MTKKEIKIDDLKKVSGGVQIGDQRIVECEVCKQQFNPDTVERGPDATQTIDNGEYGYATYKCPNCNEFHRVKVIQVLPNDAVILSGVYYKGSNY